MSGKSFACRRCPPPYNPNHVDFAPRAAVILSHPPADALHPALSASRTSISPIGISDPVPVDTRYAPARRVPWPLPPTVARQLTFFFASIQVCQFCFNNIKSNMNGLCPACRRPYDEKTIQWKVVTPEEYASNAPPEHDPRHHPC